MMQGQKGFNKKIFKVQLVQIFKNNIGTNKTIMLKKTKTSFPIPKRIFNFIKFGLRN